MGFWASTFDLIIFIIMVMINFFRFFMFLLVAIVTSLVAQSLGLLIGAAVNVEASIKIMIIIISMMKVMTK